MKKISLLILTLLLTLSTQVSLTRAEEENNRPNHPNRPATEMRKELKAEKQKIKDDFKTQKETIKTERKGTHDTIKANREETREKIKEMKANGETPDVKALIEETKAKNKNLREELKKNMDAKRTEFKTTFKSNIEKFKENRKVLKEERKGVVLSHLTNIESRLTGALTNIGNFNDKISEVITKKKAAGLDTTNAEELLTKAEEVLATAQTKVATAAEAIKEAVGSAEGISKEAVRTVIDEAVTALKEAREASKAVVTSLPKQEIEHKDQVKIETTN